MLNINFKEFCQMRKTVSKRIKAYVEKNLQEKKEELAKIEKLFIHEQREKKKAEYAIQLLEPIIDKEHNSFLYTGLREAKNYISYHQNDIESYNSHINAISNQIKEYEFGLNNWKENYQDEFNYLQDLPNNINLFVKPVKWNHPYGLFITIEKDYSNSFEFNRTWKDDYHFTDGDYILMNDFLGFTKSKKFQGHLKKD